MFVPVVILLLGFVQLVHAEVVLPKHMDGVFLAQFEGDDSYDPFADYSEFEEAAQEEADINFFRNGRFFNLGLVIGYRAFSEGMAELIDPGTTFGLHIAYFFDLRFAFQFGFLTSDHSLSVKSDTSELRANMGIEVMSFNLKYFFNTQNVTRGLADLNPFMIVGLSQFSRTFSDNEALTSSRDSAMSFDVGGGIEVPVMRNKMYLGLQGTYHIVNFRDENKELTVNGEETGKTLNGDVFHLLGIIGINF